MKNLIIFLMLMLLVLSCEKSTDPNTIGGSTDLELTKVGNEFGATVDFGDPSSNEVFQQINKRILITKNENGIVTVNVNFTMSRETLLEIDTLLGTYQLPEDAKKQILDRYLEKFGLTFDTTNPDTPTIKGDLKFRVTSEGIQEFINSKGDLTKPFTMFKYSSKLGDVYTFKRPDGTTITRKVIQVHTTEDWELAFWLVKTMRVEQVVDDDPLVKKTIYVGNHKFGWVGQIIEFKDGRTIKITILPWAVL